MFICNMAEQIFAYGIKCLIIITDLINTATY